MPRHTRRMHGAHIGAGIAALLRNKIVAVGKIDILRHMLQSGGDQRMTVAVHHRDALQLRQRIDNALEPRMQHALIITDVVIRHAAQDFVDLGETALDSLQNLERVFVQNVERAVDALVGHLFDIPVTDPGGEREQHRRQHQRCHHHDFEQPNGCVACGHHLDGSMPPNTQPAYFHKLPTRTSEMNHAVGSQLRQNPVNKNSRRFINAGPGTFPPPARCHAWPVQGARQSLRKPRSAPAFRCR